MKNSICIVGTVGVPGSYGGFETLADNLVQYHYRHGLGESLSVYCSAKAYREKKNKYLNATLRYIGFDANGFQSVIYDIVSLIDAVKRRSDVILLLGVSGAIALPVVRAFSQAKIVTNIDGIEWKREKWSGFARWFLRFSEYLAVRCSHTIIADNVGISNYVKKQYGVESKIIAYGGDHAVDAPPDRSKTLNIPHEYALSLCRIEPENNVHMILEAFSGLHDRSLVFVGNWDNSTYGRELKKTYGGLKNLYLIDPIYDAGSLRTLRDGASIFIHGHSAGGTNPSLVEMMHFGIPIAAYDCCFNRFTTEDQALYFESSKSLRGCVSDIENSKDDIGSKMQRIAKINYTWDDIGKKYFDVLKR